MAVTVDEVISAIDDDGTSNILGKVLVMAAVIEARPSSTTFMTSCF